MPVQALISAKLCLVQGSDAPYTYSVCIPQNRYVAWVSLPTQVLPNAKTSRPEQVLLHSSRLSSMYPSSLSVPFFVRPHVHLTLHSSRSSSRVPRLLILFLSSSEPHMYLTPLSAFCWIAMSLESPLQTQILPNVDICVSESIVVKSPN